MSFVGKYFKYVLSRTPFLSTNSVIELPSPLAYIFRKYE